MKNTLRKIKNLGFEKLNTGYAGYEIYRKGKERIIYDPEADVIVTKYKMD